MLKVRWTQLGPPASPGVVFVRGIGDIRVTQEDLDTYGSMSGDPELECEHVSNDPEASHRIARVAPETFGVSDPEEHEEESRPARATSRPTTSRRSRKGGRRGLLDILLGR
ncbi:MAG: hypothetical protein ACP5KN_18755 [Armatimonadota bacterium]